MYTPDQNNKPPLMVRPQPPTGSRMPNGSGSNPLFPQPPMNRNPPPQRHFFNGGARPPPPTTINGANGPQMPMMANSSASSSASNNVMTNTGGNLGSGGPASVVGQPPRPPFFSPPSSVQQPETAFSNLNGLGNSGIRMPLNHPTPIPSANQPMQRPSFPPTQTPTFYQTPHSGQSKANIQPPPMTFNNTIGHQPQHMGNVPPISPSNTSSTGAPPTSAQQNYITNDRPNELPVPFHGQGQYSHQVNPHLQNSPMQTPGNSEPASRKSSRGASPVSESAIDALEGQFAPGHGAPSPAVPGSSNSPVPAGQANTNIPRPQMHPPNTFTPLSRSTHIPPVVDQPIQPPRPPMQPGIPQQPMPPRTGFHQARFQQGPMPPRAPNYPAPSWQPNMSTGSYPPPLPNSIPSIPNAPGSVPMLPPQGSTGPGSYTQPSMSGAGSSMPFPQPLQGQRPGVPSSQHGGMPPQNFQGQMPPPLPSQQTGGFQPTPQVPGAGMGSYPNNAGGLSQNFGQMGIQDNQRTINLMNERHLIPPEGLETPHPVFPHDYKKNNCNPDVFRCTLNAIPNNSSLLNKARLPLGILIHPFRDLSDEINGQLPVIQSSVIVRCRSCRTYINPFVVFVDQKRWKCNLCFRANELPDEFSFDPVSKTYGDPQRRPEIKSSTIEFIAPSEYMLRPPQPAVYLFLLDVSFNAVETGYLSQFSQIILDELNKLPGDARTSVGFMCYDKTLYYFNLSEGLSQPQMLCVPDLEDPLLPCPDNLLVNLQESKELIIDLLNQLPSLFKGNLETGSALGPALQAAHKLLSPTGGRVTVIQTCLPTVGQGALQNRESSSSGKNVANIGPATDFYKKLSLDFSAQQVAVDLFLMSGQYADMATLSCISKYSGGSVYFYPSFHSVRNVSMVDKFDTDFRRYLTRKIGFEAVMRIRCTRGLSIHTFHGNFFVRSTDLLSLPNINPDAGFGMQMSIEDNLSDSSTVSFQAALLYTSSKGERRIRVHTLCVPVTNQLSQVFSCADQQAITSLLAKMAVDRSINSSISDARDAMINAALDALSAYTQLTQGSGKGGSLFAPHSLRLLPMFVLAMMKSTAFGLGGNTKLDHRVFAMQELKVQPLCYLIQSLYPHLYPLHRLSDETPIKRGKEEIPSAPRLQLTSANIDRTGVFLMDTGEDMYLLVGSGIGEQMCQDVFDKPNFMSIPEGMVDLPELDNPESEKLRSFVNYLMDSRPQGVTFLIIRDDSKHRFLFFQHMLEDRTESSMSYYEFLQFLQGKAK